MSVVHERAGEPIDDVAVDGMRHCLALRSRIANGRIISISPPELPGEVTLIGPDDVPGSSTIRVGEIDIPVLAGPEVRHRGEAIALLCGPNELELQRLMNRIDVRYERDPTLDLTESFEPERLVYSR